MNTTVDSLQEQLRRWVLLIGVTQVLFGCLVAFTPPTAVPWFRGIVMAHIEFTANGVLMTVLGLLSRELRLSAGAWRIWFWTLIVGTWTNGAAGLVGAFAGQSFQPRREGDIRLNQIRPEERRIQEVRGAAYFARTSGL